MWYWNQYEWRFHIQRYKGTKVVLKIARARKRKANNNIQFARLMDIDVKVAKMLLLKH